VSGFSIGTTGTLTSLTSMPFNLAFVPQASVVSMGNNYLYVAGPGAVYVFSIASNGALTQIGTALGNEISLDVSPDGNWLFGLNGLTTTLDLFQITPSTGLLSAPSTTPYPTTNQVFIPKMVKVSPNGAFIFAAVGDNGDVVFSFNTLTGAVVLQQTLAVSATTSDNEVAVDKNTAYLYIARSGTGSGLAVYSIGVNGLLTSVNGSPFTAGTQPLAVILDSTGKYAYVANGSDGNISGYALNAGVATKLSTSPYVSGATVNSLAVESTGKYLLASAFGGSPDLTMYSYDTSTAGQLDKVTTGSTGSTTGGALQVVVTH
jgi:6-phosphogluconolactonase (cycloisomerase 2 family)